MNLMQHIPTDPNRTQATKEGNAALSAANGRRRFRDISATAAATSLFLSDASPYRPNRNQDEEEKGRKRRRRRRRRRVGRTQKKLKSDFGSRRVPTAAKRTAPTNGPTNEWAIRQWMAALDKTALVTASACVCHCVSGRRTTPFQFA